MPRKSARLLAALLTASLWLAGCGTIDRPDGGVIRLTTQTWRPTEDPRIRAGDTTRVEALAAEIGGRLWSASETPTILALSGGGANGAYGAGVLTGWTESGTRPAFQVVTGVSTGALAAPFAFLGPEWDDELRGAYAEGRTRGLLGWRSFAGLVTPGLFDSGVLKDLVEEYVTPDLLRQIAIEHDKGRRLLIVTTNLDAQETVIWDMGVLARQGGDQAVKLFRAVLLASASIPGVFPPVMIPGVDGQGRLVEEMHVDGGVITPFLGIPESLLTATTPTRAPEGTSLYVLINGQIGRTGRITRGTLPAILARAYDTMSKANLRTSLAVNLAFAERNGLSLYVAAVPDGIEASSLDFDPVSMADLFERGRASAAGGLAWSELEGPMPEPVAALDDMGPPATPQD
ncbi:MAG: patatin-like phospholipase family protein [Brevundimonas sp.]|uniref:patatin-like phospholipase family protein n=1 Tax=Brevundimonas sp. TaxID=1871086 RepID=UPI00272889AC|nr:patatin-like phospholipase family protein [Brevundimonas sp.]MDO9588389.1 patatin-like phospholipase family protein [Brevundimonas sp.]MDP3656717.1 patatin-like phospholipase family protein [Brevundimonas sp.]MDZ4110449.1 patatin-like phospholipase family protein [Brevundimonas sp.]